MFYGLTIFSVFIFTYLLLRIYWWNQFIVGAIRAKDATEAAAKNVTGQIAQTVLPHFTSRQKCPSGCNTNIYPLFPPTPVSSEGPTMHTDSSHNDWLLGDLPQVQVSEGEEYETSPKPWFGPIGEEYATQYTCKWTGAGLSQNGSTSTYQGPTFQTYIPCQYYPGYKTIEKKIAGQTVMSTKGV